MQVTTVLCCCNTAGAMDSRSQVTSGPGTIKRPLNVKAQPKGNELGMVSENHKAKEINSQAAMGKEQE